MNRSLHIRFAAALLVATLTVPLGAVSARAEDVSAQAIPKFTFRGTGYGHGIGLSQYGAQGAAIAGKDYRWIIGHYYAGVSIVPEPPKTIKVNLSKDANYKSGGNAGYTLASWRILPGQSGATLTINGVAKPAATYMFTASGANVVVTASGQSAQTYSGTVTVAPSGGSPALLQVVEGTGLYGFANGKYRGTLTLAASSGKLKLLNVLPMESYLYGVVPRESPSGWKAEALKAQAIVARSYAYPGSSELYCTTMSQAYQGYGAYNSSGVWVGEATSTNAAVDATKDLVVKRGSNVVKTYFFSQSGGHTANIEDVWVPTDGNLAAKAAAYPEFRGVPDTYEHLAKPSYSPWTGSDEKTFTGLQLSAELQGIAGVPAASVFVSAASIEQAPSGHARYVTFTFANGAKVKVSGDTVRSRLGLKSTAFYMTGFPIQRIAGSSRYDTSVLVSQRSFPTTGTVPVAVLASGEDYADALAGSGLAGALDGSLLLVSKKSLPDTVRTELVRLGSSTIYILGGTNAVSAATEAAVKAARPTATIVRVAGANRYATARAAADRIAALGVPTTALLVSGTAWPDAASVSALAYAKGYPILLTPGSALGADAQGYLQTNAPATTLVVGGTAVVAAGVEASARTATGKTVTRLAGSDRYQTAARVAERCLTSEGFLADEVYVATGVLYADALTGGMLAGVRGRPLLLSYTTSCPRNTEAFLDAHKATITKLWIFGGSGAISSAGLQALDIAMMR